MQKDLQTASEKTDDSRTQLTEDELLTALRLALNEADHDNSQGAMRTREIARALDISRYKAIDMIKVLIEAGTLEMVKIKHRDITGRVTHQPAYRLKQVIG